MSTAEQHAATVRDIGQASWGPPPSSRTAPASAHQHASMPSANDAKRANGHPAMADESGTDSPDEIARAFAESQKTGLAVLTGAGRNFATTQPAPPALPSAPAVTGRPPATGARASPGRGARLRIRGLAQLRWPLLIVILTIQAVLSLRLVRSNTAFPDEALYLSAGHVEIAHWLHGTPLPAYATHVAGAPVIYPPIGAIADGLGGLAAARTLSLLFMLGATALLWSMTSRLFGRRAAVCAAALFAVLGPTLPLGAFATFDAMALLMLAASAWCMVSSRDHDDSALLLVAGTALLALANATKYSTMLFDPSVIALAGLTVAVRRGVKSAVARSGYIAAGTIGLISALLAVGGPSYLVGILDTTVERAPGSSPALVVLADAWRWAGLVWVIAAAGVILCALRRHDRVQVMILAVLATSGVLAPLDQARIHTTTSLSKHVDFGAWFAAAAAGYALAQLSQIGRRRWLSLTVAGLLLIAVTVPAGAMGRAQALEVFHGWPNSARMIADLRPLTRVHPGHYLAEDPGVPAYYLQNTVSWQQWSGTSYFSYSPPGTARPLTGLAAYRAAINRHYFSLVIFNFGDTAPTDFAITGYMRQAGYRVIAEVPSSVGRYTIWAYEPQQQQLGPLYGHR
jgi:4-amino-4-deoxy-L-arabinose transferase-like glycosyltransferase